MTCFNVAVLGHFQSLLLDIKSKIGGIWPDGQTTRQEEDETCRVTPDTAGIVCVTSKWLVWLEGRSGCVQRRCSPCSLPVIFQRGARLPSARERVRRQSEGCETKCRQRLLMSMYNISAELEALDLPGETTQTGQLVKRLLFSPSVWKQNRDRCFQTVSQLIRLNYSPSSRKQWL